MLSSHGGFLTIANVSSYRNKIIKLTHYEDTEKRAHNSQIVRAKENLNLATVGAATAKYLGKYCLNIL